MAKIFGIVITAIILVIFVPKLIIETIEKGGSFFKELPVAFLHWENEPTGYIFAYLIGYAIIWWKPLWGAIIVMLVSIVYVAWAGFDGPPIFAIPTFLVGLLYFQSWFVFRRKLN